MPSSVRGYYIMLAGVSAAATALASHRLLNRIHYERERNMLSSQISILSELIDKYKSGTDVADVEVRRLLKLADLARARPKEEERTTVMQVLFGRKTDPVYEEREMKDLMDEWNRALEADAEQTRSLSRNRSDQTN